MKLGNIVKQISNNADKPTVFQLLITAENIPLKTSYAIGKLGKKILKEYNEFYELRDKKIKEYGEEVYLDGKGKLITDKKLQKEENKTLKVKEDKVVDFVKEVEALLDTDINIELPTIRVEALGEPIFKIKGEVVHISPMDFINELSWLVSE